MRLLWNDMVVAAHGQAVQGSGQTAYSGALGGEQGRTAPAIRGLPRVHACPQLGLLCTASYTAFDLFLTAFSQSCAQRREDNF